MNGTTRTGIKRAFESAWDHLPQLLVSAVVALATFLGGLWLGHRDLVSVVDGVVANQFPPKICARIAECPICERLLTTSESAKLALSTAANHIDSHNREAEQWKQRIIRLEQQLYEMTIRPAPFAGAKGKALEERIQALEDQR